MIAGVRMQRQRRRRFAGVVARGRVWSTRVRTGACPGLRRYCCARDVAELERNRRAGDSQREQQRCDSSQHVSQYIARGTAA